MRRRTRSVVALAATLTTLALTAGPLAVAEPGAPGAPAEPGATGPTGSPGPTGGPEVVTGAPTQEQVDEVAAMVTTAATDIASVRAALVVAGQRAQTAAIQAAEAAEAYNGARYRAEQSATAATDAEAAAAQAAAAVAAQRDAYADTIAHSYTMSPGLGALSAISSADGITGVIESTATLRNAQGAMDSRYDDFRASATIAEATAGAASGAADAAAQAVAEAEGARTAAEAAAAGASAQAQAMGAQRDALIAQLAQLEDISIALADRRQQALESEARDSAIDAAIREARADGRSVPLLDRGAGPQYGDPIPVPTYDGPGSVLVPSGPPPTPGRGATSAIAFARAQIGEPYVWAAAGPDAWDCSGLTMGAWANGGKALPHYSVAQLAASTPIAPVDLRPGDLVFWGRSSDPSSIYHVALYSGNGMVIQAPRTGVPVQEVSMYAWIAPNFFARP